MAEFKISRIFTLSNRGEVLVGEIVDGEVAIEDLFTIPGDNRGISLKIQSVEFVDHIGIKKSEVALMLGSIDKNIREKLQLMIGRIVTLEKRNP